MNPGEPRDSRRGATGAEVRVHANRDPSKRMDVFTPHHLRRIGKDLHRVVQRKADSTTQAQIVASLKSIVMAPVLSRDLDPRAVDYTSGHRRKL